VAIFDGTVWIDTEPGDWVHVPVGGIHGFKNTSGAPAMILLHFCPGAPREEYLSAFLTCGTLRRRSGPLSS
jgi:oxalate decarboxylase/phosphoglucose isomerase-like protein (cupin superfamily)